MSEANRNQTVAAFGVIRRKGAKSLRLKIEAKDLIKINTREIKKNSLGVGALRRDGTIFYDDYSLTLGKAADIVNGKVKYPKMGKKMTHPFDVDGYSGRKQNAVEFGLSIKEKSFKRRDWIVRSRHAYNH